MKHYSNTYIFAFAAIMVLVVAAVLSFAAIKLKPYQEKNVEIEKKRNILASLNIDATASDAEAKYAKYITDSYVVDSKGNKKPGVDAFKVNMKEELSKPLDERNLPVYVGTMDDGSKHYVIPVRGKGLWGPIWGYVSLNEDMNTVYGTTYSHQGETPGLGAEIATRAFQIQFKGKKIFDKNGQFTSIDVVKGGAPPDDPHAVDAISGGTITSHGVQNMLYDILVTYKPFFEKHKK